jgi:hypothetical protein
MVEISTTDLPGLFSPALESKVMVTSDPNLVLLRLSIKPILKYSLEPFLLVINLMIPDRADIPSHNEEISLRGLRKITM